MKRLFVKTAAFALSLALFLCTFASTASAAVISYLSGPETVSPGETVTISLSLDGIVSSGISGTLMLNENVEFESFANLPNGWTALLGEDGQTVVAYDKSAAVPIESGKTVFGLKLKINPQANIDEKVTASFSGTVSDGKSEMPFKAEYSAEITECTHKSFVWTLVTPPVGAEPGVMAKKCRVCGWIFDEKEISVFYGDANGDGNIDLGDAILAARYDVGIITADFETRVRADVNGDGIIDIKDALLIAQFVAGVIDEFPAEWE